MFNRLDDQTLSEVYYEAIRLNLDTDFISILKEELDARGLDTEKQTMEISSK
ncbi:sporulation histidine kinase inhibitor Sda [Halalkalibacter flavus]|jgi:hypothetical protein|uniref:sporulation histidine kinase inhibitor Sda n=1 Tax=Halalkalibacter flavus TaxID=3090668 RepID=UPI002FCBC86D